VLIFAAIADAVVFRAVGVDSREIVVMRDDDTVLRLREAQVLVVIGTNQIRVYGRANIHTTTS
jgi:hypothetical protein